VLRLVMPSKTFTILSVEINKVCNVIMIVEYAERTNSRAARRRSWRTLFDSPSRRFIEMGLRGNIENVVFAMQRVDEVVHDRYMLKNNITGRKRSSKPACFTSWLTTKSTMHID
jgi:hypothetical protein